MSSESTIKEDNDVDVPLEKQSVIKEKIKKPRKPKTPGQLEQFEKVRLKRLEDIKQKNVQKKIEASKLLLDNGYVKKEEIVQKDIQPEKIKTPHIDDIAEDESDNEIIIVKKKPKKKKTFIIEESSDDDDDEELAKEAYKERKFVSQQKKKSVIKIHQPPNYFV